MKWNHHQARYTLILFLLIFTAGQVRAYLSRPVYPEVRHSQENWLPDGYLVDATALENRTLEVFPRGATLIVAISSLGLEVDPLGSGYCLPRAGVLYRGQAGWRIRPMTQRERWVWRIPMDLYRCDPDDLRRISGIGPSLGWKIYRFVKSRGYVNSLSDLEQVPGVGPGKLKVLKRELALN